MTVSAKQKLRRFYTSPSKQEEWSQLKDTFQLGKSSHGGHIEPSSLPLLFETQYVFHYSGTSEVECNLFQKDFRPVKCLNSEVWLLIG